MYQWNRLNSVLNRFVEEGILAGCGMQIYKENQLIYDACAGASTADGTKPLTANTRLRLHSMTKNFTCAGLMTLYDKGLFALDDPIADYLPEFSNPMVCISDTDINDVVPAKTPITIRQLLSMKSGIPYWSFNSGEGVVQDDIRHTAKEIAQRVREGQHIRLEDFVKIIAKKPLCFQPGERWLYGLSLTVVGRLIEVLSGMRISEYLHKTIWGPLGLINTCFTQQLTGNEEITELMVSTELCESFEIKPEESAFPAGRKDVFGSKKDILPGTDLGIELPCGGMISTLHDLGRLFAMFANGGKMDGVQILGRRTIDLMRTNQLSPEQLQEFAQETNKGFGYGLGYRTLLSASEAGFYMPEGSFGWDGASGCYGLANPDHQISFVFVESSLPHHIRYTIPRVVAAMNADMDSLL